MAYGSIVENLVKALAQEGKTRLEHMVKNSMNVGGSNANMSGAAANSDGGGLGGLLKKLFGDSSNAGSTGASSSNRALTPEQVGGLGAIAGAILGGGSASIKGALGGGVLGMLGTLAVSALQNKFNIPASALSSASELEKVLDKNHVDAMQSEDTEKLVLRAMISAAKADGQLDEQEMDKIMSKVGVDGITAEEQMFIYREINKPMNIQKLVADVPNPLVAAQVYSASLFAIDVDTDAERQYLKELAQALSLDADAVKRIHDMTGAPTF